MLYYASGSLNAIDLFHFFTQRGHHIIIIDQHIEVAVEHLFFGLDFDLANIYSHIG
jgi:hypothetical protein